MPDAIDATNLPRVNDFDAEALIGGITEWVEMETPSERPDLIDRLLNHVEAAFERLPVSRERRPGRDEFGGQLILRYAPEGVVGKPALLMGHIDTVWETGTLQARPVRREDGKLYGPGIFDMKAGSYLATETLRLIARKGLVPPRPITVFLNSDEEVGSPVSREIIEALCRESAFVLVPEPAFQADGTVVTARKGWGRFTLSTHGRSAHAGGNLRDGRSAIREIARHILEIEALNDTQTGATFNVGVVKGGTRLNVVPERATIEVDMRADDVVTAKRMVAEMKARTSHDPDVDLTIEGGMNRPPFERTPTVAKLYQAARVLADALALPLAETSRGGVSDGNFAAALGLPVLDGMGCNGAGAHAIDEHIALSTVPARAALMHGMLMSREFQTMALT